MGYCWNSINLQDYGLNKKNHWEVCCDTEPNDFHISEQRVFLSSYVLTTGTKGKQFSYFAHFYMFCHYGRIIFWHFFTLLKRLVKYSFTCNIYYWRFPYMNLLWQKSRQLDNKKTLKCQKQRQEPHNTKWVTIKKASKIIKLLEENRTNPLWHWIWQIS